MTIDTVSAPVLPAARTIQDFQVTALSPRELEHLFALNDTELSRYRAVRQRVTTKPGAPCRVSLADAEVGEEVLLLHYTHQAASSPFHASHAIYVRPGQPQAMPLVNEIPAMLHLRTLSVRAFDGKDMMVDAELATGEELRPCLRRMLGEPDVRYLHLHFAKPGCYAARVDPIVP